MTDPKKSPRKRMPQGLIILHEDADIIVVDKAPGLLTVGTDKEKERTAYFRLTDYVRKGNSKSRERIFIVHRLDKDTSGVLVFARNYPAKQKLQDSWESVDKTYLAVVRGTPSQKHAIISSYLTENKAQAVKTTYDKDEGKLSRTQYKVIHAGKACSMLELNLLTGRKNQIRVHLSELGHPIMGDKKYGETSPGPNRLALHAVSIKFQHPVTGEAMFFKTQVPPLFMKLVGKPVLGAVEKESEADEKENDVILMKVGAEIKALKGKAAAAIIEKEAAEQAAKAALPQPRVFTKPKGKPKPTDNLKKKKPTNRPFSKKQAKETSIKKHIDTKGVKK